MPENEELDDVEPAPSAAYALVFTASGSVGRGTADHTPAELQEQNR